MIACARKIIVILNAIPQDQTAWRQLRLLDLKHGCSVPRLRCSGRDDGTFFFGRFDLTSSRASGRVVVRP